MSDRPTRKIRLVGSPGRKLKPVKLTPPSRPFIWNIGQPTCPGCRMVFSVQLKQDEHGKFLNYDIASNEVVIEHPGFAPGFCVNSGEKVSLQNSFD